MTSETVTGKATTGKATTGKATIPSALPDPEEQLRALAAIHGDELEDVPVVVRLPVDVGGAAHQPR